jgi:hypothetical protein
MILYRSPWEQNLGVGKKRTAENPNNYLEKLRHK